jgi:hypothetical protein
VRLDMATYIMREVKKMKVVVVQSPRFLRGILRRLFRAGR